ncbi:hypothetical protein Trydic_g4365 [Trypoxylus dichotomus]
MNALSRLGGRTKVKLACVPGHESHRSNVKVDELARGGSSADKGLSHSVAIAYMILNTLYAQKAYEQLRPHRGNRRFCGTEEDTPVHLLCDCTALVGIRLPEMGSEYPKVKNQQEGSLTRLLGPVKKAKLM